MVRKKIKTRQKREIKINQTFSTTNTKIYRELLDRIQYTQNTPRTTLGYKKQFHPSPSTHKQGSGGSRTKNKVKKHIKSVYTPNRSTPFKDPFIKKYIKNYKIAHDKFKY
jgi:hypothetical protein